MWNEFFCRFPLPLLILRWRIGSIVLLNIYAFYALNGLLLDGKIRREVAILQIETLLPLDFLLSLVE